MEKGRLRIGEVDWCIVKLALYRIVCKCTVQRATRQSRRRSRLNTGMGDSLLIHISYALAQVNVYDVNVSEQSQSTSSPKVAIVLNDCVDSRVA